MARESFPETVGLQDADGSSSSDASDSSEFEWDDWETGGDADRADAYCAAEKRGCFDCCVVAGAEAEPKRVWTFSVMAFGSCPMEKTPMVGAYVPRGKSCTCMLGWNEEIVVWVRTKRCK